MPFIRVHKVRLWLRDDDERAQSSEAFFRLLACLRFSVGGRISTVVWVSLIYCISDFANFGSSFKVRSKVCGLASLRRTLLSLLKYLFRWLLIEIDRFCSWVCQLALFFIQMLLDLAKSDAKGSHHFNQTCDVLWHVNCGASLHKAIKLNAELSNQLADVR